MSSIEFALPARAILDGRTEVEGEVVVASRFGEMFGATQPVEAIARSSLTADEDDDEDDGRDRGSGPDGT